MRRSSYAASQKAQYTRRSTGEITYSRPEAVAGDGRRLRRAARRTRGHERGRSHHRHSEEQRRFASAEGESVNFCEGPERVAAQGRLRAGQVPAGQPQAPQARRAPQARQAPAGPRRRGRGRPARLHRRDADADERELERRRTRRRSSPSTTARRSHVTVPANETDKLIVIFSAEDACYGGTPVRVCNAPDHGRRQRARSGSAAATRTWTTTIWAERRCFQGAETSSYQAARAFVQGQPARCPPARTRSSCSTRSRTRVRRGSARDDDVPPGRLGARRPARPRHLTESRS